LLENLVRLSRSAPAVQFTLPPELIQYVESTRNPDVFTREFVELAQRTNQLLKGRSDAYRLLRDTLAKDIVTAIPELKDDVARICQSTGDKLPT
jgi:mediator of RNA polymerase II transcription subunit 10